MAETVYEMMMKLSLDHATAMVGLNMIGARLVNLTAQANSAKMALVGLGGIAFGGALLIGLTKALETAKEFSKEMTALRNLGGPMEKLVASGEMDKKIFGIAKLTGQKVEDIAKIAHFVNSVLGTEDTMKVLPELSKFQRLQGGAVNKEAIQDLMRAGMITGRITDPTTGDIDLKRLHDFIDEFQRLKSATGGKFSEEVLLGMAKQGGGFLRGLSTEGMEHMAIIAQSLGGPRTGTAFLSIYEQLARGQMTKKTAEGMEAAGLLKPGQWSMDKNTVKLDPEVSKSLTAKFGGDPLSLAKEIRENLIRQGITDPQEQMRLTANAFGRQTSRRFMAEEVADYQQMIGEGKRLGQAAGVDKATEAKLAHDMEFNLINLQNAWHNLMVAFSDSQSDAFIVVLQKLQGVFVSITDSIKGVDPETLMFISKGIAALGIALIAGGMVAVIAAIGPTGWLIGAFAALAAINWDKIQGIVNFVTMMGGVFRRLDEWSSIKIPPWMQWNAPKLDNQGYEGPAGRGSKSISPINFNPGNNQKQILQPVTIALNLDGRMMGQAMSEILEDLYTHPTSPPSANGWDHFRPQGSYPDI